MFVESFYNKNLFYYPYPVLTLKVAIKSYEELLF